MNLIFYKHLEDKNVFERADSKFKLLQKIYLSDYSNENLNDLFIDNESLLLPVNVKTNSVTNTNRQSSTILSQLRCHELEMSYVKFSY